MGVTSRTSHYGSNQPVYNSGHGQGVVVRKSVQQNAVHGGHHTTTVVGSNSNVTGGQYHHHTSVNNVPQVRMDIYGTPAHGNPTVLRNDKMSELKTIADATGFVRH